MSKVKMTANEKSGSIVNQYANSEKGFGFMNLRQTLVAFNGNRVQTENRSCLMRGNVSELKAVQEQYATGELPGRIRVVEMLEESAMRVANGSADKSNESDAIALAELHSTIIKTDYEKAIKGFVKKREVSPNVFNTLTKDGQRILRMQVYDATGNLPDIKIQHDGEIEATVETIDAE